MPNQYSRRGSGPRLTPYQRSLKQVGSSVLFLAAAIGLSAQTILTSIHMISTILSLQQTRETFQHYEALLPSLSIFSTLFLVIMIVLAGILLPTLLITIGIWIFYFGNLGSSRPTGFGLGFTKAGLCLQILYSAIVAAVIAVAFFAIQNASEASGSSASNMLFLIIVCIIIVVFLLALFYYMGAIKTINVTQEIARIGGTRRMPSMYLIIMNYLLIILKVFFLLVSQSLTQIILDSLVTSGPLSILGTLSHTQDFIRDSMTRLNRSTLIGIVILVLFNVVLHYMRGKLTDVRDEDRAAHDPNFRNDFDNTYF